jgi:hypothetical protein
MVCSYGGSADRSRGLRADLAQILLNSACQGFSCIFFKKNVKDHLDAFITVSRLGFCRMLRYEGINKGKEKVKR